MIMIMIMIIIIICMAAESLFVTQIVFGIDSERLRSQSELFAGKSDWQWKEFSTSLLRASVAVCRIWWELCLSFSLYLWFWRTLSFIVFMSRVL